MAADAQGRSERSGLAEIRLVESPSGSSALRSGLAEALDAAVDTVLGDPRVRAGALVLGADDDLGRRAGRPATRARAEAGCRAERAALHRLATSPKPFVAWLVGPVGGLSLELALACRARLVLGDGQGTAMTFSDLEVGLAPRLGGLGRVMEIGGLSLAVSLGTVGRSLDAREAEALGLVDAIVPQAQAAQRTARLLDRPPQRTGRSAFELFVTEGNPLGRTTLVTRARRELERLHGRNYPAQEHTLAILDALARGRLDLAAEREAMAYAELSLSSTARTLHALRASALEIAAEEHARTSAQPNGALGAALAALGLTYAGRAIAAVNEQRSFVARIGGALEREAARLIEAGAGPDDLEDALHAWGMLGRERRRNTPKARSKPRFAREVLQMRCVLPLVMEALRALEEGVVPNAAHGDVAAVFLGGFPPFRGGPFRYVDEVGPAEVLARTEVFARELGSAFEPPRLLRSLAERGGRLYPTAF
jgi:enoyl-CoA hydratase/carnithine racemase